MVSPTHLKKYIIFIETQNGFKFSPIFGVNILTNIGVATTPGSAGSELSARPFKAIIPLNYGFLAPVRQVANLPWRFQPGEKKVDEKIPGWHPVISHTIHGIGIFTYIWLIFLVKCRGIYHTWMIWVLSDDDCGVQSPPQHSI